MYFQSKFILQEYVILFAFTKEVMRLFKPFFLFLCLLSRILKKNYCVYFHQILTVDMSRCNIDFGNNHQPILDLGFVKDLKSNCEGVAFGVGISSIKAVIHCFANKWVLLLLKH